MQAYLLMTEGAKFHHGVHTVNISISAQNACFGSWWQQLLIDNIVGYDTILMNSLLNASGRGIYQGPPILHGLHSKSCWLCMTKLKTSNYVLVWGFTIL
jgi:hypothetical protein